MQLPGRLRATTLGDVLGALHREQATGTLELAEQSGRTHRIHLAAGLVTSVELDRASASLAEILRRNDEIDEDTLRRSLLRAMASRRLHGEVLVRDFHLSAEIVGRALRNQAMVRLAALEEIADAQILFRVAVRPPRGALTDAPLGASEFLAGKKRLRDRNAETAAARVAIPSSSSVTAAPPRSNEYRQPTRVGIAGGASESRSRSSSSGSFMAAPPKTSTVVV